MRFRPCIDIHNGKVKQIVGDSLKDNGDYAEANFVADKDSSYYAELYRQRSCPGGHIILLNNKDSIYYGMSLVQAQIALESWPGGFQIGGGIDAENAPYFLQMGASHVIVTSYIFSEGELRKENLGRLKRSVGPEHIVMDLSCRRKGKDYYIVTNRWQTFTRIKITKDLLAELADSCDEFLIHGVDSEGKCQGIEEQLVGLLGEACLRPVTYAGGVSALSDLNKIRTLGKGKVDVTIGSALDIFGGSLPLDEVLKNCDTK